MRQESCTVKVGLVVTLLAGCATPQAPPPAPPPRSIVAPIPEEPQAFPADTPQDLRQYFVAIHRQLDEQWRRGVLAMAATLLAPDHPANRQELVVELALKLDDAGQPTAARVEKSSGYVAYDESALRAIGALRKLPVLPASLSEGHATLHWRLHRDDRACSPIFARIELAPLTPEEALQRALARGQLSRARRLLAEHGPRSTLVRVLAEAGLAANSARVREAAVGLLPPERLEAVLQQECPTDVRYAALDRLVARGEVERLVRLVERAARSRGKARPSPLLLDSLQALAHLGSRLPPSLVTHLLADSHPAVVSAAAAQARAAADLDAPLKRWHATLAVSGPLAVARRALVADEASERIIRAALASASAVPTLQALARQPLPAVASEIEAIVRDTRAGPGVRVAAIRALVQLRSAVVPLYAALRSSNPDVQIAAARALGQMPGKKLITSYRLAELAFGDRTPAAAEVLAALVRVGEERFRGDVLRRLRLLDPSSLVVVAAALPAYGEGAVPALARLLGHPQRRVRQAAAVSLTQIPGRAAQQALGDNRSDQAAPALDPLEALVRRAAVAHRDP